MREAISVSKLNTYIKQIFDAEELLHNIPVLGEVFGVSLSRNVIYFSLKDENATLPCVCFYPNYIDKIVEGDKLIVTGTPSFYIKGGKLNFNVVSVEKVGMGQLYEEFLKLKAKLEEEGLFSSLHKKAIPTTIKRIGVITSREGAVIQDIKNIAWRRDPSVDIVLYNTKVQGQNAENEIAHAIDVMGSYDKIDCIVVARGGGSLEDLWAYNTEVVARATYNCPKPIISAVGHETDFTIIDFVSDLRAPTPSAAAELLTNILSDKKAEMYGLFEAFRKEVETFVKSTENNLAFQGHNFALSLSKNLNNEENQLNGQKDNFLVACKNFINQKSYELGISETTLNKLNPLDVINRGYARIEQGGKQIKDSKVVDLDKNINIILRDGQVEASPIQKRSNNESK